MQQKFKVIVLCGSVRFKEIFLREQKRLTLQGKIVLVPELLGENTKDILKIKETLAQMHKQKIDMADEIFVINVGGYVGETTKSEIAYALSQQKTVRYLEPISKTSLKGKI